MSKKNLASIYSAPELGVFVVPPTQVQIYEDIFTDHTPFTAISNSTTPIQFNFRSNENEYIHFGNCELHVKFVVNLRKTDGSKLVPDDWKRICPINYLLNTMWKSVSLSIGNEHVTATTLNYPYISYLDALLNINTEVKMTYLRCAKWMKDTSTAMDDINEVRSLEMRPMDADISHSCEVSMHGRLHLDLCDQIKALIGGLEFNLTLHPHNPEFYLMYDNTLQPSVRFTEIVLKIHRFRVVDGIVKAHQLGLKESAARYFINHRNCKNFIIPKDSFEYHENNVIKNDRLPRKCFIGFVSNEAYLGRCDLNPFNFKNYDIQNIRITLNNKEYPPRGHECDFKRRHIDIPYFELFEALGDMQCPKCSISRTEFMDGFTIFGFNFAPDLSHGANKSGYITPIKVGDMALHIRFRQPISETATAIILMEYDNLIEITEARIPVKDFA